MNVDPYAPPKADLVPDPDQAGLQFYVVSIEKFTVLFFATLGLYSIYWFYRNWHLYKTANNLKMWPVARAIFNIFFVHKLFSNVKDVLEGKNTPFAWSPNALATGYIILSILSNVMDRLATEGVGSPISDILSLLFLPAVYFTLRQPQQAINLSQDDPQGAGNSQLTPANIAWIIAGLVIWGFAVLGLLMIFGVVDLE